VVVLLVVAQACSESQSYETQPVPIGPNSNDHHRVKWLLNIGTHFYLGGPDAPPPIVIGNNGIVYAGGRAGLFAIKPDGLPKWDADNGVGAPIAIACGSDGTIYTRSFSGHLSAFRPDGSRKWTLPVRDYLPRGAALAVGNDGTIYTINLTNFWRLQCTFCAVNPDGSLKWGFETNGVGVSSIAVGSDGTVYLGTTRSGTVFALTPSGALKWKHFTDGAIVDSIVIGRLGTIYALYMSRATPTGVSAVNPDGSQKWRFEAGDVYNADGYLAVAGDDTVYRTEDAKNRVVAINSDGSRKWAFTTRDHSAMGALSRISTPSVAVGKDGVIYAADHGNLFAINPDGSRKWSFVTGNDKSLTLAPGTDGSIYANSWDNKVYALRP
jgi:hypothetical protein